MKKGIILVFIAMFVFIAVFAVVNFVNNSGGASLTYDDAVNMLPSMLKKVSVSSITPRKATIELGSANLADELPEITKYSKPVDSYAQSVIEIFSSTEKAGTKNDNWLVEVAQEFNNAGYKTSSGKDMGVTLWSISSGTAVDYIISGKYVPDAFTPSNELWGEMVRYAGVPIETKAKRLVGNVAGILMDRNKNNEFVEKYGEVSERTIVQAVEANDIVMGYTNPLASSTGLNFLLSVLYSYDPTDILSAKAAAGFDAFQANVPSVAHSTLEMRDSVVERKTLDAMILEYQLYKNEPKLAGYIFTPFGVRHDNPMYAIGNLSDDKAETLEKFTEFCLNADSQALAKSKGFNYMDEYVPDMGDISSNDIVSAQQLWKVRKNAGRPVAAIFIADISGSMAGEPISLLQSSLINAANYIDPDNYVGLISYSTDVYINLPMDKFDLNQQSLFIGAVSDLDVGGSTATYDAVLVALNQLSKVKEDNPQVKPMLFLLSDGEQNAGYSLSRIKDVVQGMGVPVYTIGYNAKISELSEISAINEASYTNAESDDITYILKGLFNAQM